ncbi:MAG: phosphatase PAP2 family protein [Methanosarcinales archaeon]|nr:phosphatase PAP2 family protein [Methanosarcinales archaeon]
MEPTEGMTVIHSLQSLEWMEPGMQLFSFLGTLEFYLIFMPALYWCVDARLGLRVALVLVLGKGMTDALKLAFHSPRPYWVSPQVKALSSYPSFAMPSGHAEDAVAVWGMVARGKWKRSRAIVAALVGLIGLIGISRIYLGVHFPADVLAGYALGAAVLAAFLLLEGRAAAWMASRGLAAQILASFLASLALLSLSFLALAGLEGWQMPAAWEARALASSGEAIDPLNPREAFASGGMLFGVALGALLLRRRGQVSTAGRIRTKAARYLLGMAGLLIIWYGSGAIMDGQGPAAWALIYLRSFLAGAWVAAGAPELFRRMGLAGTGDDGDEQNGGQWGLTRAKGMKGKDESEWER